MFAPMRAFPRSPSVGFALGLIFPLRKLFQKFRDTIRNRLRKIVMRPQVLSDHPLSLTNGRSFFGLGNTLLANGFFARNSFHRFLLAVVFKENQSASATVPKISN
jgi:hypothetical protein